MLLFVWDAARQLVTPVFPDGQKGRQFLARIALVAGTIGVLALASTKAEAQSQEYRTLYAKLESITQAPNCFDEDFIRDRENEIHKFSYFIHYTYGGVEADSEAREMDKLIPRLREKICPPEPVKRYSVGTLFTPAPQERQPIGSAPKASPGPFHPFFALDGGGGWSNTNFAVTPPFNVNGSSFIGGINGGVMFDIPGTIFSVGPRIGWLGGNMSGTTSAPAASPFFDYNVKTISIFYQEARISSSGLFLDAGFLGDTLLGRNITPSVSAGIAEVQTKVTGTSGAFQVTDSVTQTGFTGTVGIGVPISPAFLGGTLGAYAQYRFIALPSTTVSIPGQVQIDNRWIQGINFGLEFRY